ncbi:MAG: proton-conducting transporter membrane subunit [Kiritimatiellae bacterium]|nr:proton-conducting transporter membrane subunit [Kiritimatiellia bacterium]
MSSLLPLFIAVPLGAAFFIPLVSLALKRVPDLLANAVMLALAALACLAIGQTGEYVPGGWGAHLGAALRLDGLTVLMLIIINTIGLAMAIFSVQYMTRYTSKLRYYSIFLCMVAGLNGIALTGDLFSLYIFMEIVAISSYALVAFGCEHDELEAAFKYAVLGTVASAFILIGIALLYAMLGTLNMVEAAARIAAGGINRPLTMALGLFICGFGLKAALVPFHAWLPDAHPSAPAPVSAILSGVVIKTAGIYVLARLVFNVFSIQLVPDMLLILRTLGLVSMVAGGILSLGQWDMKRLLAYSSISQIGYIVVGLGLGTPLGLVGALFHMLNHSVFKSLLFLNAGAVEYATGSRDLKSLGGLWRNMPFTANISLVGSMSISGIPPFNGFWSKLIIVLACLESGHPWLALAAVAMSLATLAALLKMQKHAFYNDHKPASALAAEVPFLMRAAMILLAVLCVLIALLVLAGFRNPYLIGPAADALRAWGGAG